CNTLSSICLRYAAGVSANTPDTARRPRVAPLAPAAHGTNPRIRLEPRPGRRGDPVTRRTNHRPHLRPGKHPPHTVLVQLHPDSFSHRSALRPVKIHDNAPLRSAGEVGVVVPHAHVADRVPFKVVEHNPVIRARARTLDRREHLHAPNDRVPVRLERLRQPRLAARRDPINGPRLVLPRKRRIAVTIRLTLDPVTDSERLSNATHHAPS